MLLLASSIDTSTFFCSSIDCSIVWYFPSSTLNLLPFSFYIRIGAGVIMRGPAGLSGTASIAPLPVGFFALRSGITSSGGFGSS